MRSLALPALQEPGRLQLVGRQGHRPGRPDRAGARTSSRTPRRRSSCRSGHMSSQCHSPTFGCFIGLALVGGGRARLGETLFAVSPVTHESTRVRLVDACFVDPEGARA